VVWFARRRVKGRCRAQGRCHCTGGAVKRSGAGAKEKIKKVEESELWYRRV